MNHPRSSTRSTSRAWLIRSLWNATIERRRADDLLSRPRSRYWGQCLRRGTILKKQERLQRRQAEAASRVAQAEQRLARFDAIFANGEVARG